MKKLKNFFNKISNNNRIFSREDIGEMSKDEFAREEKAIDYQVSQIGAPPNNALSSDENVVYVQEHTRNDGTKVKAHYRSKFGGSPTGATANPTRIDSEFNRPLTLQIKNHETNIPNVKNYLYYDNLNSNKLQKEVGDFLNKNTNSPKLYSNDIRHQYASAIYTRNFGADKAKSLGNLHETLHLGNTGSGAYDTELDKLNNEIGRNYGVKYPNVSREQLLHILLKDWEKNSEYVNNIMKKRK